MNKLLLGTSALVGAIAFAGAAMADAPKVTLGGFVNFQAGFVGEDNLYDTAKQDVKFRNDTEIHVRVDGVADNGLRYGGVIELEADQTDDRASGTDTNADKTYVYLEGGWGRFELGGNVGAQKTLKVDAATFARATGGIDGDWWYFAGAPAGGFLISPDSPIDHGTFTGGTYIVRNKSSEDANKITYYSPRFAGFQIGGSYTADVDDTGQASTTLTTGGATGIYHLFGGGINYNNQFGDIGLAASLTGEFGEAKATSGLEDVRSWALGAYLTWQGFTFGGSYGDWSDSLQPAGVSGDRDYWTAGLAYDFGPFGASATYMTSDNDLTDDEFQNIAIGLDYMLAPGLVPYVEVNFFEFDTAGAGLDNDGTTVILGTQLSF